MTPTEIQKKLMKTLNLIDGQNELIKSLWNGFSLGDGGFFPFASAYFYYTIQMIVSPLFELI